MGHQYSRPTQQACPLGTWHTLEFLQRVAVDQDVHVVITGSGTDAAS
jgi:hypothetical protein